MFISVNHKDLYENNSSIHEFIQETRITHEVVKSYGHISLNKIDF